MLSLFLVAVGVVWSLDSRFAQYAELEKRSAEVQCSMIDCTPLPNSSFKMNVYLDYYYNPDRGLPEGLQHPDFLDSYYGVCQNITCNLTAKDVYA